VFVDNNRQCQDILRQNLAHTGLASKARVVSTDARSFLAGSSGPFDIAFLDPPYNQNLLAPLLPKVAAAMAENGVIVCEAQAQDALPEAAGEIPLYRKYRYGKTQVVVYRRVLED
jgi:16S rRNA G966 N2-methylase RsmD